MISSEDGFNAWAPDGAAWTEWAKPVIFLTASGSLPTERAAPAPSLDLGNIGAGSGQSAVIVDLPGVEAVDTGLALASRGYRPVPLFNGTQGPSPVIEPDAV